jgi:TPR repeat protein
VHEAVRLYELAAAHGEFMAKLALGRIYSRGERLPVDLALASKWYSAALSGGEAVVETKELSEAREFLLSHPDT